MTEKNREKRYNKRDVRRKRKRKNRLRFIKRADFVRKKRIGQQKGKLETTKQKLRRRNKEKKRKRQR